MLGIPERSDGDMKIEKAGRACMTFFGGGYSQTEMEFLGVEIKKGPCVKKKSGLATVSYRQSGVDGNIVVVDLEGFYTSLDVFKKYGKGAHARYFSYSPDPSMLSARDSKTVYLYGNPMYKLLVVGEFYAEKDFLERIELMKWCGKRLGSIAREERAREALNKKVAPAMELRKITI